MEAPKIAAEAGSKLRFADKVLLGVNAIQGFMD